MADAEIAAEPSNVTIHAEEFPSEGLRKFDGSPPGTLSVE